MTPHEQILSIEINDNELALLATLLRNNMSNCYMHANSAAQDKTFRYYAAGTAEKFLAEAKTCEALLVKIERAIK